jgi:hypothetical protein
MPMLCIAKEKLRAIAGDILSPSVKIGYDIEALPSGLEPATKDPKSMVSAAGQRFE